MSAWPRGTVDVACWDLKGKAAAESLYRLLGGHERRVRAYASSMDATRDLEELPELHGQFADEGFTAFKTKPEETSTYVLFRGYQPSPLAGTEYDPQ